MITLGPGVNVMKLFPFVERSSFFVALALDSPSLPDSPTLGETNEIILFASRHSRGQVKRSIAVPPVAVAADFGGKNIGNAHEHLLTLRSNKLVFVRGKCL